MTEVSPQQNIPRWDLNYICLELHNNGTSWTSDWYRYNLGRLIWLRSHLSRIYQGETLIIYVLNYTTMVLQMNMKYNWEHLIWLRSHLSRIYHDETLIIYVLNYTTMDLQINMKYNCEHLIWLRCHLSRIYQGETLIIYVLNYTTMVLLGHQIDIDII